MHSNDIHTFIAGIGAKIKDFYAHYNHDPTTNIKTVFSIPAEHGVVCILLSIIVACQL